MTNNNPTPDRNPNDARAWAWMQAWDHLEAATKLQEKHKNVDLTNPVVKGLHRTAEIYAQLADVDAATGELAAEILISRQERDKQQRRMMNTFLAEGGA